MDEMCLIQKSTITSIANAVRATLNTTDTYPPQKLAELIGSNTIVDGTSLVNYNINFSFS